MRRTNKNIRNDILDILFLFNILIVFRYEWKELIIPCLWNLLKIMITKLLSNIMNHKKKIDKNNRNIL